MPVPRAVSVFVRGTMKSLKWTLMFIKALYSAHFVLRVSYCDPYLSVIRPSVSQQLLQTTYPPRPVGRFRKNFTEMFIERSSTKFGKIVLLRLTKWPPELKIEKIFEWHLPLDQWTDFKIISQKCSFDDPLPKLVKSFRFAQKMAARAKNRKNFKWHLLGQWTDLKIVRQKSSLGDPLQKLLKSFCSAEQNGLQS